METRAAMQATRGRWWRSQKGIDATGLSRGIARAEEIRLPTTSSKPITARSSTRSTRLFASTASSTCRTGRCKCAWVRRPKARRSRPPHFKPGALVGNTDSKAPSYCRSQSAAGPDAAYDDFNYPAVAWTLSAHEGRPGHELQFTAMVERGISLARTLFAFNSVNVEGWALYAEAEMVPYEPLDGQLIALQFRLMRAARAMLDPMLNLGMIERDRAGKMLTDDVVLSKAMARQELDRYTFNAPGQAGAYFYGYSRLMELRMETELALGDKFDRLAFNNFLLDQGLLPPHLLAQAVREQFIPAQQAKR